MAWITAEQALARLRTKPQTLYANVSRGRIQSRPDPDDTRRSLYRLEDVKKLAQRRPGPQKNTALAAQTIAWGEPVMSTAISTIVDGRLYYRGHDAVVLAQTATLEAVAALLWESAEPVVLKPSPQSPMAGQGLAPVLQTMATLAASQLPSLGRSPLVLQADAHAVFAHLVAVLIGGNHPSGPIHERLAQYWDVPQAAENLRQALVLLVEHELNASTFAVRTTVSTGASLAAGVLAGLAALSGPLHGGATAAMADLVRAAERASAQAAIQGFVQQGRPLPCFGHRLYPNKDIRAAALLANLPLPPLYQQLSQAAQVVIGEAPNIDFALAALTAAYQLPTSAPLTLFALARTIGWLAHGLEQARFGTLIRPRANYIGPTPIIAPTGVDER